MRLAIADPPYLGRAHRWYGGGRGPGRDREQTERNGKQPEPHPHVREWDRPETHIALLADLAGNYDGVGGVVRVGLSDHAVARGSI